MSVTRIATRYAKSLIELAAERNELEGVKGDVQGFTNALESRDLVNFLKSPIIRSEKKLSVFKAIFEGKLNKTTQAFFDIIIRKNREMYLPEIAHSFMDQYREMNGISTAKIITASPLTESALEEIKKKLLSSDLTMDKLEVTTEVDPNIIGGFIIEVGDRKYDASVAYSLDQLKRELV